jgi:hypothetical protein
MITGKKVLIKPNALRSSEAKKASSSILLCFDPSWKRWKQWALPPLRCAMKDDLTPT